MSLLEINIISAQDLPPVSKMLRTFAVAYMHPDHKLTTRVDHQGHTNPTWNYKLAFHVDEKFLKQESSAITIEIYNVAWLRDLPIGTTHLFINNLSPPLHKNPSFRRVSLQIARPSGHLQGTLNLGVQLVHTAVPDPEPTIESVEVLYQVVKNQDQVLVPGYESNIGPMVESVDDLYEVVKIPDQDNNQDQDINKNIFMEEYLEDQVKNIPDILISEIVSENDNMSSFTEETRTTNKVGPEPERRTMISATNSMFSTMRPLPTEVAEELRKGVYTTEWKDYGSSVFENWTEPNSREDEYMLRSKSVKWKAEDQIPLKLDTKPDNHHHHHHRKKRSESKKGLMSCFGNAYGFQFSFICGSKTMKKKKKNRNVISNFQMVNLPE